MSEDYQKGVVDGLYQAEEIAVKVTDDFWNAEFARHGNAGVAKMKQKVGHQIEAALFEARKAAAP